MKSLMVTLTLVLVALVLASCSRLTNDTSPSASPAFSPPAECERSGGVWRPVLDACDFPGGGGGGGM